MSFVFPIIFVSTSLNALFPSFPDGEKCWNTTQVESQFRITVRRYEEKTGIFENCVNIDHLLGQYLNVMADISN